MPHQCNSDPGRVVKGRIRPSTGWSEGLCVVDAERSAAPVSLGERRIGVGAVPVTGCFGAPLACYLFHSTNTLDSMPDRIALKRLTASDLTFFENLFRTLGAGNQKAINLNADVFIDRLYPALPGLVPALGDVIPVSLTILGPAGAAPHVISRAITKREGYKNWRLNGEFVRDPEGQPGRFDALKAGDISLMDLAGDPGPQRLTLLLVAAAAPADAPLHAALNSLVPGGRHTMVQLSRSQIAVAAASVPASHPVWQIAADPDFQAALEDAAQGGLKGAEALRSKASKTVTAAALAKAKAAAEKNGREGEALAWVHLQKMNDAGIWSTIVWSSKANAVSPFDFSAIDPAGAIVRIDAKSTGGAFDRVIHMSIAELTAATAGDRYDLWRVYEIDDDGAKLRISEGIGTFAQSIMDGLKPPTGVTVDSVSMDPGSISWGGEIVIKRPEEELAE